MPAAIWIDYPGLPFHFKLIASVASAFGLDPLLVAAIVLQESGANADAFRHERLFWNRYLKLKPEWKDENPRRVSSSYGLMQVMYPVAVERGLERELPPEVLFVPESGLHYGCKHLAFLSAKMDERYPQATPDERRRAVLASYNGGFQGPDQLRPDNRRYADTVLGLYARLKTDLPKA